MAKAHAGSAFPAGHSETRRKKGRYPCEHTDPLSAYGVKKSCRMAMVYFVNFMPSATKVPASASSVSSLTWLMVIDLSFGL